jgi:hypothetical protein
MTIQKNMKNFIKILFLSLNGIEMADHAKGQLQK